MKQLGIYLYGFIPRESTLDLSGIEGVEGAGGLALIEMDGANAVTAEIEVEPFEAAIADGPDPGWLIPRAIGHERVLGALLARTAVLPVRFGTLFSSRDALENLGSEHLQAISKYFTTIGDQREWSLRGYFDEEAATAKVLEDDPELADRFKKLPDAPGARYFQEKKLREQAKSVARRKSKGVAAEIRKAVVAAVTEAKSLPLRGSEGPGREMILHEALLVPRGSELAVIASVEAASNEGGGMVTLEPSGPWPPFHFCPQLGEVPQ